MKLGILASHPIQYQAPLFRALAHEFELKVYFAHKQIPEGQAAAGFSVAFDWDIDLLDGYPHVFLKNVARRPDVSNFWGCDTPGIAGEIEREGFDAVIVCGWHLKSYWQAMRACRRVGMPVMARGDSQLGTQRSGLKRALKALIYPWLLRQFDGLLYVGRRNREYLEHYGARAQQLFFAPHCVDNAAFAAGARAIGRDAVRKSWGLDVADRAVLFAGKLLPIKRPEDLVAALKQLKAVGAPVVGVFAGDGPLREALASQGQALGVSLAFLGFCNQSKLPPVYGAADVLVLPSSSETWGLVVNEAMACGIPAVVSDAVGCAPDLIEERLTGSVYPVGDVASLVTAIEKILARGRTPSVQAALQRKTLEYSIPAAVAGIRRAVENLVEGNGGG